MTMLRRYWPTIVYVALWALVIVLAELAKDGGWLG